MSSHVSMPVSPRTDGSPDVRHAWWCVVAWFPAAVVSFVAGEGLGALLGQTGEGLPAWWVGGTALLGAVVVLAVPTVLARVFDRRARRAGDERARVPALVVLVLTGIVVAMNLFSWAMRVLLTG